MDRKKVSQAIIAEWEGKYIDVTSVGPDLQNDPIKMVEKLREVLAEGHLNKIRKLWLHKERELEARS